MIYNNWNLLRSLVHIACQYSAVYWYQFKRLAIEQYCTYLPPLDFTQNFNHSLNLEYTTPKFSLTMAPGIIWVASIMKNRQTLNEDQFNRWYTDVHLDDVLGSGVPDFAMRYKNVAQDRELPYLALYHFPDLDGMQKPEFHVSCTESYYKMKQVSITNLSPFLHRRFQQQATFSVEQMIGETNLWQTSECTNASRCSKEPKALVPADQRAWEQCWWTSTLLTRQILTNGIDKSIWVSWNWTIGKFLSRPDEDIKHRSGI